MGARPGRQRRWRSCAGRAAARSRRRERGERRGRGGPQGAGELARTSLGDGGTGRARRDRAHTQPGAAGLASPLPGPPSGGAAGPSTVTAPQPPRGPAGQPRTCGRARLPAGTCRRAPGAALPPPPPRRRCCSTNARQRCSRDVLIGTWLAGRGVPVRSPAQSRLLENLKLPFSLKLPYLNVIITVIMYIQITC